jgi:hypothetical protein
VTLNITVFLVTIQCNLERSRRLEGIYSLQVKVFLPGSAGFILGLLFDPEDRSHNLFRNIYLSPNYSALEPKKLFKQAVCCVEVFFILARNEPNNKSPECTYLLDLIKPGDWTYRTCWCGHPVTFTSDLLNCFCIYEYVQDASYM